MFRFRDALESDIPALWQLNQSEAPHVGSVSLEQMKRLFGMAKPFRVAESAERKLAGFILAMDETAPYLSQNFLWFHARYPRFIYVDRLAVARPFRRKGLGRLLYADIMKHAQGLYPQITCEVNLRPPNPDSIEFHRKCGFHQVGIQDTEGGSKTVSLLLKEIGT